MEGFQLLVSVVSVYMLSSLVVLSAEYNDEYDVIIMGAGISGLSAATELYNNGITNILIIEAQDYIGGRMKTIEFDGYRLNGGATWLHGACTQCSRRQRGEYEENPILQLVDKYNISFVSDDWDSETLYPQIGAKIKRKYLNRLYRDYSKAQRCVEAKYYDSGSFELTEERHKSYRTALKECGWIETDKYSRFVEWYEFDFEFGAPPDDNNAYSFLGPYDLYGDEDLFITDNNGYQSVPIQIAAELERNGIEIILNEAITTISYDNNVLIETVSGNQYYSKYGIITFSIGVLQSDLVSFNPVLPKWKIDAINKHEMAHYMPMYIKWPYNFWNNNNNDEEAQNFIFIDNEDDERGYFVWAKNLNQKQYFPQSNIWRVDVVSNMAVRLQKQSEKDTIYEYVDEKLQNYFEFELPEPLHLIKMNWTNNVYTAGAYSLWPNDMSLSDWEMIKKPINNLYFCGEATSFEQYGYVSGAYLEGIDTAKRIIQCLKGGELSDDPIINDIDIINNQYHELQQPRDEAIISYKAFKIIIGLAFMLIVSLCANIIFCVYRIFLIKETKQFHQKEIPL